MDIDFNELAKEGKRQLITKACLIFLMLLSGACSTQINHSQTDFEEPNSKNTCEYKDGTYHCKCKKLGDVFYCDGPNIAPPKIVHIGFTCEVLPGEEPKCEEIKPMH